MEVRRKHCTHERDRYQSSESDLPWNYEEIVRKYLGPQDKILDIDTGGGEVLLSFGHPYHLTTVTEGYAANVKLCEEKLGTLGIRVCEVTDYSNMPFENDEFYDIGALVWFARVIEWEFVK